MTVCGSNFCPDDADSKDIVLDDNQSNTINESEPGVGGNFQTDRTKIYVMASIIPKMILILALTKRYLWKHKRTKRRKSEAGIYS